MTVFDVNKYWYVISFWRIDVVRYGQYIIEKESLLTGKLFLMHLYSCSRNINEHIVKTVHKFYNIWMCKSKEFIILMFHGNFLIKDDIFNLFLREEVIKIIDIFFCFVLLKFTVVCTQIPCYKILDHF